MQVVNTGTNSFIGGVRFPAGVFEYPMHGTITIIPDGGVQTNLNCGSGDTLVIWSAGAGVIQGTSVSAMMTAGVLLSVGSLGILAGIRRSVRFLTGNTVREV